MELSVCCGKQGVPCVMSTTTTSPPSSSPPPPPSSSSPPSPAASYRRLTLSLLFVALALGTAYSVLFETYLDTSDPYLASLVRHPAHDRSYFARKRNVLNTLFVKRAWGWTVLVSSLLALAGRRCVSSLKSFLFYSWRWWGLESWSLLLAAKETCMPVSYWDAPAACR